MSGPSRADRLNSLFNAVVHKNRDVGSQSTMFIEAICVQKDAAKCIGDIVNKDKLVVLRNAVCSDSTPAFLNNPVHPFLLFMQHPVLKDLSGGLYLRKVIQSLADGNLLLSPLTEAFESKQLSSAAEATYAWFILQLLLLPGGVEDHGTFIKERHGLLQLLLASSDTTIQTHAAHIKSLLFTSVTAASSVNNSLYQPGGRHDNDKENFREISILPTPNEILFKGQTFYRRSTDVDDAPPDEREATYLDNQFRLYREDMMYELKEEIGKIMTKKIHRRVTVVDGVTLTGVYCGEERRRIASCLTFTCAKDFPQLSGQNTPQKRLQFWKNDSVGKKMLRHQTLFCVTVDGQIVSFGTIHRDETLLSQSPPVIVLQVSSAVMLQNTLQHLKHATDVQLVQIDTGIFAYEPVLRTLQSMRSLPLCKELLMWDASTSTTPPKLQLPRSLQEAVSVIQYLPTTDISIYIGTQQAIKLDPAQASSLLAGLTQTVSLIQGPPGTGKSFIGALLAKFIHKHTTDKILVVCFTNHALDQFLEDLMKIGIPDSDMVRLGGKSTSATECLTLRNQGRVSSLSADDRKMLDSLRADEQMHWQSLETSFQSYTNSNITLEQILAHIEFEDHEFFQAFTVPDSQEEMQLVGKKGKNVNETYLLRQWKEGKDAGIFKSHAVVSSFPAVWSMKSSAREAKYNSWKDELLQYTIDAVASRATEYDATVTKRKAILQKSDIEIIGSKRIIGCTTTGGAMYKDQIQGSQPEVLLVEEAGEILESHVITALGASAKQLILIGDHKQLRPKVNHYALTVEKGDGYDLNRSLFERLVHRNFPHNTLIAQHRMRPEIANMIRHLKTYDTLNDAPRTANRPNLRGVRGNIVFIDHTSPEDDDKQLADRRDMGSSTSKQNSFEIQMAFRIVRYIIQQGYKMDDIVVLTPYLGQLQKLRKVFESDAEPLLSEQDLSELLRAGVLGSVSHSGKPKLRMATIDNYQGEESDIVVVSLCRSNSNNDIGFMYSAERLNVLLSRARNALVMIGNSHTFTHSKKGKEVWAPLMDHIREKGYLHEGFPTECTQHPTSQFLLKTPPEFDVHCPDGGCDLPCGKLLSCNKHQCPSKCHPQRTDHSKQPCHHVVEEFCPANHSNKRKCSDPVRECKVCVRKAREEEKRLLQQMEEEKKREVQKEAHDRRMQELADKIAKAHQERQDDELEKQRAIALQTREEELKRARELAQNSKRETKSFITSLLTSFSLGPSSSNSSSQPAPQPSSPATSPSNATVPILPASQNPVPPPQPINYPPGNPATANQSGPEAEWQRQKDIEGANSPPIDAVMELIGLKDVKLQILHIKDKVEVSESQGTSLTDERFNIVLLGNPGTGKTTVARQYAKFLTSKKIVSGYAFIETTGSLLAHEGVAGAEKIVKDALNAGGGAIFIDEAYQLVGSGKDTGGSQVLDYLLAEMENRVGKIVFILAGYRKQMEKFFEHNPGLRGRVPYTLQFADYTDAELQQMLTSRIRKKYQNKMQVEDGIEGLYARIAVRRLGRGRGREGFGNARDLQNMFAKVTERQAARIKREQRSGQIGVDPFLLTKEDFIGPDPEQAIKKSSAWNELHSLIGLQSVKDSVKNLFDLVLANYHRELKEKEPLLVTLNRVFLGSPGTGKTTVGKLYGQILSDIGMLSNGEVIIKNPSDFTGAYIGHSEKQTKAILDSSVGKVLIIDEAYMLYGGGKGSSGGSNNFQTAVIDTIVAEIQNVPGDDRCVLLLGYEKEMKVMFQNVNPGLSRRFAIEDAFRFEDFTDSELGRIVDLKLRNQDLEASDHGKKVALELLARERKRPNFGNGGAVENLLSQAKTRYMARMRGGSMASTNIVFGPEDFDPDFERHLHAGQRLKDLFKDVVGCEEVIRKLEEYQIICRNMKERDEDPSNVIPTNFLFKGPPGTGKTTVARKIGHIYYDMGFLAKPEVHECSATDLVGQYVGQTGPKTAALFEKALGQVLFIDEAYRLAEGRFAQEALDEMVGLLTQEKFKGKIVVILAGYDQDINRLLTVNSGLSSRFPEVVPFNHFSPATCLEIMRRKLEQSKVTLPGLSDSTSAEYRCLLGVQEELVTLSSWGNARDMETLAKQIVGKALRGAVSADAPLSISIQEALDLMLEMLNKNRERSNLPPVSRSRFDTGLPDASASFTSSPPPPPPSQGAASTQTQAPPRRPPPPPAKPPSPKPPSSPPQSSSGTPTSTPPQPSSALPNRGRARRGRRNGPGSPTDTRQQPPPPPPQSRQQPPPPPQGRQQPPPPPQSRQQHPPSQSRQQPPPLPQSRQQPPPPPQGPVPSTSNDERDPGVTDDVWNRLQQDRRREAELARRKQQEIQQALQEQRKAIQEQERKMRELNEARQALRRARDAAEREAAQRRKEEAEKRQKEAQEAQRLAVEACRKKREAEEQRKEKERKIQTKLRELGRCPQGYEWVKNPVGYRCRGGAHFMTNGQIGI